jgi:hypothetical protein
MLFLLLVDLWTLKLNDMKVKMVLLAKGVRVEKVVSTERDAFVFERDMPAKHGLLYSKTPYAVGRLNLELI